jgi:glutamyl-tRNA synthetase
MTDIYETPPVVRFAPSPTGFLHVGNIRAALFNWLFARRHGGTFILRLDDTDRLRGKPEFEVAIERDLQWLGLGWDRKERQSDRLAEYDVARDALIAAGRLYPCYETPEELEFKRKRLLAQGRPPIYDRAALRLGEADRARFKAEGRNPHWRFTLASEEVRWDDLVRGPQHINEASQSDPVLVRADGSYLYSFTSVVDDVAFGITHVIRGEDHVTNSGAQIQMFMALGARPPVFAHLPLLVDASGGGLSKRTGSLSVGELRERGVEALAVSALLARLGTADPVEPVTSLDALVATVDFSRIGRAAARFSEEELAQLSARTLHVLPYEAMRARLAALGADLLGEAFWLAVRGNLATLADVADWVEVVRGPVTPLLEEPAFLAEAAAHLPAEPWDETMWKAWTSALAAASGRKGRALFHPLRLALTAREKGPEMAKLLPLIGRTKAIARLRGQSA